MIFIILLLYFIYRSLHSNIVDIAGSIINLKLFSTFLQNKSIYSLDKKRYPSSLVYLNADTDRLDIITDNKGKAGIYLWTHKDSGKVYVGSSIDISKRLNSYYSLSYLIRINKSYICNALLKDSYSAFSFTIQPPASFVYKTMHRSFLRSSLRGGQSI